MPEYFIFADIIGITAFSLSGFLVAIKNKLDVLGIVLASALTALGGGIIRDTILGVPPFAFSSLYPAITLFSTLVAAFVFRLYKKRSLEQQWMFVVSDTIGLVAFSITGAVLAINANYNFFGLMTLSFITAMGGGVTRDIMINQVPSVLISDFYGSIVFPARKSFRALPRLISTPRQTAPPADNRWKCRGRSEETGRAKLPGVLRNIGGIDHLFLLDYAVEDGAVAKGVDSSGDPAGAMKDLNLRIIRKE